MKNQSINRASNSPIAVGRTDDSWIGEWYVSLERAFAIKTPANGVLRHLCDAEENANLPVHSWFNLKEAFSAEFPLWIVDHLAKTYGFRPTDVLDPFCGGGTTPLALSKLGINAAGVEYNPFIAWVAKVKSLWSAYDVSEIERVINDLEIETPPTNLRMTWPKLTTFKDRKYFRRQDVRTLLYVLSQLEDKEMSIATHQFLRAGVAVNAEDVANLRRDGRALRHIRKPFRPMAAAMLEDHFQRMLDELKGLHDGSDHGERGEGGIWLGNALDLATLRDPWDLGVTGGFRDGTFDLVLYSPPYLNNFDYSETYKLELWLLGFLRDYEQWRLLRRGTLRSHHSVTFDPTAYLANDATLSDVFRYLVMLSQSDLLHGYAKENMPPVILGYFDDMYAALKEQFRVLRPGGFLTYMVSNSRHSDLPIATDVILGEIARTIGFEPMELFILHKRNGRTRRKRFLRESAVILKKPDR